MSHRTITAIAMLTASTVMPQAVCAARVTGHLYVAIVARPYAIERFPLIDGLPARNPDFKYPGSFGAIAAGEDGAVYGYDGRHILVFASGNPKAVRSIDFPNLAPQCGYPAQVGAIAVDRRNDLYVAYTTYFSGARTHRDGAGPTTWPAAFPCLGVVVYAPTANGRARPISTIDMGGQYLDGVAVDADGKLYVSNSYWNWVQAFRYSATMPKHAGHLTVGMNYPNSLVTDTKENVYELDGGSLAKLGVNVYAPGSGESSSPKNTLTFNHPYEGVVDIAVRGGFIYTSDDFYQSSIDVYDANSNGPTNPLLSLPVAHVWRMAAGP